MTASTTSRIQDLVRNGRITAAQGAMLLELHADIRRARRPRWQKALEFVWRVLWV